jgi:hypothetical protein
MSMHVARSVQTILKTPIGRLLWTKDKGEAGLFASQVFATNLSAVHYLADGSVKSYDLGSGLVTHAGVLLLSQDVGVSGGSACFNACRWHAVGSGTTAATAMDTTLQTPIGSTATAGTNTAADASPNATFTSPKLRVKNGR